MLDSVVPVVPPVVGEIVDELAIVDHKVGVIPLTVLVLD